MGHHLSGGGHQGHLGAPGTEVDGQHVVPAQPLHRRVRGQALITHALAARGDPSSPSSSTVVPPLAAGSTGAVVSTDAARTSLPTSSRSGPRKSSPSRWLSLIHI